MNDGITAEVSEKSSLLKLMRTAALTLVCSIVIFGGIFFEMGNSSGTICKRTTPLAIAIAIESAVNNIYSEYGKIPDVGDRVTTDSPKGVEFLTIILGTEGQSAKHQNPRAIKFLAVKEGKNCKGGLIYDAKGRVPEGLFDPWGNPYSVILDTDYDEQLHFDFGGKPVHLKGRRVAVFSPGADHKIGTSDDVTTWK